MFVSATGQGLDLWEIFELLYYIHTPLEYNRKASYQLNYEFKFFINFTFALILKSHVNLKFSLKNDI